MGEIDGSPSLPPTAMKFSWLTSLLMLLMLLGSFQIASAQNIANYAFAGSATGTLEDLSSGATVGLTGNNDSGGTAVHPIGFDFYFMGVRYTHFSANANGQFRLHTSAGDTAISTTSVSSYSAGVNTFAPMAGDNEVNNGIRFKIVGTAPNRKLVIEFNQFYAYFVNITNAGNMQAWLNEGTSAVAYVYGEIYNSASSSQTRSIFISAGNTATTAGHVLIGASPTFVPAASPVTNTLAAGSGTTTGSPLIANLGSSSEGTRWIYTFTPINTTVDAPTNISFSGVTGSGMTVNWVDNSTNEGGFIVTRATDAGFTQNVVITNVASTTSAGTGAAYTLPVTGLNFGSTYYYSIKSIVEAGHSAPLTGSQATASPTLSGVKTVGSGGDYANLTTAFAAINANGLVGDIDLQLIAGYPASAETYPIASSNTLATGSFTVKVYPTVSGLSITSANVTGTLNLNNARNVIIDGRVNQAGPMNLIIANTNAGATSYAVQFVNDATNNTIRYCDLRSVNTSTSSGTIVFGTTTGANGNDGNTIANCDIRDGAATPLNGIYSVGTTTTTAQWNDNNTVSDCNIYNFFSAGSATNGILVGSGNSAWTITGNSVYQTVARTYTTANTHTGINITNGSSGNGYTISNNFVGGTAPGAGGTAYTMAGTVANIFRGITLSAGSGAASNVQGNTVKNISFTTSSGTSSAQGIFSGINISSGVVNVGTVTGNTIGASTGNGSITITSTTSGAFINGIYATSSSSALSIQNNTIGSVSTGGAVGIGYLFNGILAEGSSTTRTISNNNIGSATANSISLGVAGTTAGCTFYGIWDNGSPTTLTASNNVVRGASLLSSSGTMYGIRLGTAQYTANNNQIFGLSIASTTASTLSSNIYGIYDFASPTSETLTGNQINTFNISVNTTATGNTIAGIYTFSTTGTKNWSGNVIRALSFTNSGVGQGVVYGIRSSSSSPNIFKNKVYDLSATGGLSAVYGISVDGVATGGIATVYNNLIGNLSAPASSLTAPAPSIAGLYIPATSGTVNAYFNTINISGTGGANFGTAAVYANTGSTVNLRNNIFSNTSTPGGTGKAVAYQRSSTTLTSYAGTSNNNLFYTGTPGAANLIYFDGTNADQTLAAYKTRMATRDQASVSENPQFVSTSGSSADFLHINTATPSFIEGGASPIATVTDDYDGNTRNATTPDIGADEFEGTAIGCQGAVAGSASAAISSMCVSGSTTISGSGYSSGSGTTYQWQSSTDAAFTTPTDIGTASATYTNLETGTITASTYYRLKVVCPNASVTDYSTAALVTVTSPTVVSTVPGTRCGAGTVTLSATANPGEVISWYAAATGGAPLATGTTFTTPTVSSTTNFYAAAATPGTNYASGRPAPASGDTGSSLTNWGIVFDVLSPVTLQSVDLYSTAAGTVDIKIMNAAMTTELYSTGNVAITNGGITTPNVVPINFTLAPGTGYRILVKSYTGVSLVRSSTVNAFPYNSTALNVTASEWGGTTTGTYYYFYNIKYSNSCSSARTSVAATVTTPPAITLSASSTTICAGASSSPVTMTSNIATYDTYTWTPSTNVSGDPTNGYVFNPSVTTTYTLTGVQSAGDQCNGAVTHTVTVVSPPVITGISASPATICSGATSTLAVTVPVATVNNYSFSGSTGTYTPITGTATTAVGDDMAQGNLPIGFTFTYNGNSFTTFAAASNGFVELGSALTYADNTAANWLSHVNALATRPNVIAGFWDDNNTTGGSIQYLTTGTAGNRVLTVQWTNMHVGGAGSDTNPTLSMQIRLFEANGQIQIIYGSTSAALSSPTASVGISGAAGNYRSVTPLSPANTSTSSSSSENTSVTGTNIPTGTTFSFVPPSIGTITWSPAANLYTDAAATVPYTGTVANTVYAKLTAPATYTATATNSAGCTSSQTVSVTLGNPTVAEIVNNGASVLCVGGTTDLDSATPAGTYSTSNALVASVNQDGIVTAVAGGTVTISYSITDNGCTTSVTTNITVNTPISSSNPIAQTVVTGTDAVFSVTATGDITGYQWKVSTDGGDTFSPISDDAVYSGTTTATLTINDTPAELNENMYMVSITGASPCPVFDSAAAVLNVGDTGIETDPASLTLCSTGAGEAVFTVVASGTVDAYAWEEDQGLGFAPIADGTFGGVTYSGSTTDQLTVTGLGLTSSGWAYRAVVTGPANGATSNPAILTVNEGVAITSNPSDMSTCYAGGSSVFTVAASGNISGYQWQYSTNGTSWSNVINGTPAGATYTGATTASLTVATTSATPVAGTYLYRAMVNAAASCSPVSSAGAQLHIYTPTVSSQPTAATVFAGNTATFTVATNEPSATYQWQYASALAGPYTNVVNNTPSGITYSGADTATLSVNVLGSAPASSARYYRAVVTSGGCSINSNGAQLTTTNYCLPTYTAGPGTVDNIVNVTLGTLNNTTGALPSPYYTSYDTVTVPDIQQLTTANVSVKFGNDTTNYAGVWIDFNNNGVFEASEGAVSTSTSAGSSVANGTSVISIPVPLSAVPGKTRMRVRGGEDVALTTAMACGASSDADGEAEDYFVNILPAPVCSGAPVAGTVASSIASVCQSGSAVLTATGYTTGSTGISLQWYNTVTGLIAGATSATYTTPVITETSSYYLKVSCAGSGLSTDSNTITVTVDNPIVVSTTPATRCGTGTVQLGATGSAGTSLSWFADATGGAPLHTGSTYTTPSLAATTTYYVAATTSGTTSTGGKPAPTTTGSYIDNTTGIVFNATEALTLTSAVVYPIGTGTITVGLYSSSGTELMATSAIPVTGTGATTPVTIPLNFSVPIGTGYRLMTKAYTGITGLIRDGSPNSYPFNSPGLSVTGGYFIGASSSYYFFYNLSYITGCSSARTAVTATVNTAPSLTLSSTPAAICAGQTTSVVSITSNVSDFDTYTWSPASGVSGNAASGYTFNPVATTTYTLNASQSGGSQCVNSAQITITVNSLPQAVTITPSAPSICPTGSPVQLSATIGTSSIIMTQNFNGATTGWTITNGTSSPTVSNWDYITAPFTDQAGSAKFTNFTTVNGGKFAMSNPDAGGSGSVTTSVLTSPVFSTVGLSNATLTFEHAYKAWSSDSTVKLEISTNGGSTWSQLVDYKGTDIGNSTNNTQTTAPASVSLGSYLGQANVRIRFNYVSTWGYYWIIDDVKVIQSPGTEALTWSPQAGLYTDAAGTLAYSGGPSATVYAKPSATTTYTATATTASNCSTSSQVTVTVGTVQTWYVDADADGFGNSALATVQACSQPAGYAVVGGDCNDAVAAINPGHAEVLYNGVDDNCDGQLDEGFQFVTGVTPSQCGSTLATISSLISAVSKNGSTGYRFEVTNTATSAVQVIDRPLNWFSLNMLASYDYATTYSVRVQIQKNGIWLGYYGPACLVSSPAILDPGGAAQVAASQCGITLPSISTLIATNSIQ
ncbi:MAG TPA: GEVED domain-containing protein, partial [Flavobacterium sp.]